MEKVPKKKVPRTEKRENGYYLLILYHGLIFYERVPIRRLPGLIWDAEAPFSEASMGKSGAFKLMLIKFIFQISNRTAAMVAMRIPAMKTAHRGV